MYKRKMLRAAVGVCICTAWIFGTATAFAAGQAEKQFWKAEDLVEIKVHDEEKAHNQLEGADQLILVKGTGGCEADISYYVHTQDSWQHMWTEPGYVGSKGITEDKKEGDKATPTGIYSFNLASAFWRIREVCCLITGLCREISGWMILPVRIITVL